jgi:hypothetical protein
LSVDICLYSRSLLSRPLLTTLNVAHNLITSLAADLFVGEATMLLNSVDMSYNNLKGRLPDAGPLRTFKFFSVAGNPNFGGGNTPLPKWTITLDEYSKSLDQPYICPKLSSVQSPKMSLLIDPSYYSYSTCQCDRGTFGRAPQCFQIPESQTLSKQQFNIETIKIINNTFTDDWYGNQRMSTGLFTSWIIDQTNMKQQNDNNNNNNNNNILSHNSNKYFSSSNLDLDSNSLSFESSSDSGDVSGSEADSISDVSSSLPVLMINITFYFNLDSFDNFTDIIDVFEGGNDLKGVRVYTVRGNDFNNIQATSQQRIQSMINGTEYENILSSYQNLYVVHIPVFSSMATIHFQSRAVSKLHFFASFTTSTRCPDQYIFNQQKGQCQYVDVSQHINLKKTNCK